MADRVHILRRLDARIEEAETLVTGLADLRDEFKVGSTYWCGLENARYFATRVLDDAGRVRDGMRVA